jgi:hypothetical protein
MFEEENELLVVETSLTWHYSRIADSVSAVSPTTLIGISTVEDSKRAVKYKMASVMYQTKL